MVSTVKRNSDIDLMQSLFVGVITQATDDYFLAIKKLNEQRLQNSEHVLIRSAKGFLNYSKLLFDTFTYFEGDDFTAQINFASSEITDSYYRQLLSIKEKELLEKHEDWIGAKELIEAIKNAL